MIDYKYVEKIVRTAGNIMMQTINDDQIHTKGRADFVTDKDVEVQQYIYERLHEAYPEIGFIGEEKCDYTNGTGDQQWILDPIDGTTNYIYGYNLSAISLALKQQDNIIFGIVYNPFTNELFRAAKGQGAYLNDKRINASKKAGINEALIAVGTSPYDKNMAEKVFESIREIFKKSLDIRRTGSAAIDMAYVACGRQDAYFEYNLKPWDFAAGYILVEEAGGIVKKIDSGDITYDENNDVLACCNENVMKDMLEIL